MIFGLAKQQHIVFDLLYLLYHSRCGFATCVDNKWKLLENHFDGFDVLRKTSNAKKIEKILLCFTMRIYVIFPYINRGYRISSLMVRCRHNL